MACQPAVSRTTPGDFGINFADARVTSLDIVQGYRNAYPAIIGLWRGIEQAAMDAVRNQTPSSVGRCHIQFWDKSLCITLPSRRVIYFRNVRLEYRIPVRGGEPRETLIFDAPKKGSETTYGGKLVENVVQAICRDLLAATIVRCEQEELPVVLHVHDEVVIEAPEAHSTAALHRLLQIMSTPPSWAAGFPVEVEGFVASRYLKSPPAGSPTATYRNGTHTL